MNNLKGVREWTYLTLAWIVFSIHLVLVIVVSAGWLVPQLFYVFLAALIATLFSEIFLGYCPLTRLEFGLRKKIDPNLVFDKSCIVHYIRKWRGLSPRVLILENKTFFKKYTFTFILLGLLLVSLLFRFVIYN